MFSSQEYIDNKTGKDDLNRFQYLQALVTEFQDTESDGIWNISIFSWGFSDKNKQLILINSNILN